MEASETSKANTLALEGVHEQLGATMREFRGWLVPASYGDPSIEYSAVRQGGAGLIDLSSRGRIRVDGGEAVQFLNGLVTNDMKTLAVNSWMPAAFPNVQGRLLASTRIMHILENDESAFLIDTEPVTHERVLKTLQRFTLAGDFHVSDISKSTVMLSLQGQDAAKIASVVYAEAISMQKAEVTNSRKAGTILRATHTGENGFDFIVDVGSAAPLWEKLMRAGAHPVGYNVLETIRLEAGIPSYGTDMDDTNVVTEANLDHAVSYTKGCYIGQEIIARIKYRGHVAKKLTGIIADDDGGMIRSGSAIQSIEGKEIGRVTSVTLSPQLNKTIALGYVRYEYLKASTKVMVTNAAENVLATVHELPFLHGSWYEHE
ncbi:MAG: aminomethyltransferase family protein [Pyrinomonadaceae bacterium]